MAKAVLSLLSSDIEEASGPLLVCADHIDGCKATILGEPNTECVLVDAENVFKFGEPNTE